jgi:hypothetical protein
LPAILGRSWLSLPWTSTKAGPPCELGCLACACGHNLRFAGLPCRGQPARRAAHGQGAACAAGQDAARVPVQHLRRPAPAPQGELL